MLGLRLMHTSMHNMMRTSKGAAPIEQVHEGRLHSRHILLSLMGASVCTQSLHARSHFRHFTLLLKALPARLWALPAAPHMKVTHERSTIAVIIPGLTPITRNRVKLGPKTLRTRACSAEMVSTIYLSCYMRARTGFGLQLALTSFAIAPSLPVL